MEFYTLDFKDHGRTVKQVKNQSTFGDEERAGHNVIQNEDGTYSVIVTGGKSDYYKIQEYLWEDKFPPRSMHLGYVDLYKSVKVTDFIYGDEYGGSSGYIVSNKVKDLLQRFNIGSARFYPFQVRHRGNVYDDYSYFLFKNNADPYIDWENSVFCMIDICKAITEKKSEVIERYQVNSLEELKKLERPLFSNPEQACLRIRAEKLTLSSNFPWWDVFTLDYQLMRPTHVSSRVKDALVSDGITGLEIHRTDYINVHL